jgi:NodT family efflux transporter outer membrane factor (OMF) lipoprotein
VTHSAPAHRRFEFRSRRMLVPCFLRPLLIGSAFVAFAMTLSSCKVGPDYKYPYYSAQDLINEQWRAADPGMVKQTPQQNIEWWKVFNDPKLDSLIEEAAAQNLTLHAAGLRIIESRLARSASKWAMAPGARISGSAARVELSQNVKPDVSVSDFRTRLGDILATRLPDITVTPEMNVYRAGVDAIWDIDVWGKSRRRIESNRAAFDASVANYDDVLVSLIAEVAASYIEIRTLQQRLDLVNESIALQKMVLAAAEGRVGKNDGADLDVELARTILCDTMAIVPTLEGALSQAASGLCVLLGKPPYDIVQELGDVRTIPAAPVEVMIGAPADLLRRRPDIRRAEREAAAQCALIGVAKADLYPSFALFGGLGLGSSNTGVFFESDSVTSKYGGLFGWNILLYPLLQQNVRFQDAKFQESILYYKQTVLTASREVEDAATLFVKTQQRLPLLLESSEASKRSADLATDKYGNGEAHFSSVLDSLQLFLQQEDRYTEARGQAALSLIATYKALGGGWEIHRGKEVVPEEIKEQMRKETDWRRFDGPLMLRTDDARGAAQ